MRPALRTCARAAAACVLVALVATGAPAGDDEGAEARFTYLRDVATPADAARRLVAEARARGAESIAFVLDRATFDPPPGVNEFTQDGAFVRDVRAWLDGFVAAAAQPGTLPVSIAATTSPELRDATAAGARDVAAELDGSVWIDTGKLAFAPAAKWIDAFGAELRGRRKAIALVTGNVLPERWIQPPFDRFQPRTREPWRSSLLNGDTYWPEEDVAAAARRRGVTLLVVAPEARFGDEAPIADLPEPPFASRPRVVPFTPPEKPELRRAPKPDVAARAAMADEMRRRGIDDASIALALAAKDRDAVEALDVSDAGRFTSSLPTWFPIWGTTLPWTTDCPSGHGWWPFARAAAATGGAFVLYPYAGGRWMDPCLRDDALLDALGPPLGPRAAFASAAKGDPALTAMLRAQEIVLDPTPWTDWSQGYNSRMGGLWGWCGFELPGPAPSRRWEARRKPFDLEHWIPGGPKQAALAADRAAEAYVRAIRGLAAAQADPRVARAPRRSQAHLRLCRTWFEMSLFHLQALAIGSRDPVAFGAKDPRADDHYLATWNAVRMSDCLPAYDGRVLTAAEETAYGMKWSRASSGEPYQGAFLAIGTGDPNHRALRDADRVLAHLDARLRPQALATIAAAREVITHEARSPWGWVVYYAMLHTYAWSPPDGAPAATERGGSRPPAGSSGGGTTTPK